VRIDGPFGSASEDCFKYEVAVCVGAGIGVTPFSSVLKSIWYHVINPSAAMKLRKVYFIWICRDTEAFEWFQDLLQALEAEDIDNFLQISIYLTGGLKADQIRNIVVNDRYSQDALTGLRSPTLYGRPNFDVLFHQVGGRASRALRAAAAARRPDPARRR
jgi:NADPH oxidase